ncbi:hypothetical protein GW17_00021021 [Ensete ventricosum]|nr:hypothetical protein GW17_00021021 [Ensete ventricosum]
MLILLAASLMACTYTTQIPLVKVARRWSFMHSADAIRKQDFADSLPRASIQDLGIILMGAGYEVMDQTHLPKRAVFVCFQGNGWPICSHRCAFSYASDHGRRSMLARDLQSIVLYDQEGKFAGVRRPSSKLPIDIDGTRIVIEDAIGSSGLDLKVVPGNSIERSMKNTL